MVMQCSLSRVTFWVRSYRYVRAYDDVFKFQGKYFSSINLSPLYPNSHTGNICHHSTIFYSFSPFNYIFYTLSPFNYILLILTIQLYSTHSHHSTLFYSFSPFNYTLLILTIQLYSTHSHHSTIFYSFSPFILFSSPLHRQYAIIQRHSCHSHNSVFGLHRLSSPSPTPRNHSDTFTTGESGFFLRFVGLGERRTDNPKKKIQVGGPQSISSSFIFFFVLNPFFLNTKNTKRYIS